MIGSIEVISNGNSVGMVVNLRNGTDDVPEIVALAQSLDDVEPVEVPEGVTADAAWRAVTEDGFDALVLWREARNDVPEIPAGEDEG